MAGLDDAVIAKLKSHGFTFEILVDCESALAYKEGKETDLDKVILAQEVIDDVKSAEAQVQDIVKKLQRVLPIKFEIRIIEIKVAAKYTSTAYNRIKGFGRVLKENWNSDGSLSATLEIPAGLQEEFEITLNSLAHGQIELNVVERK